MIDGYSLVVVMNALINQYKRENCDECSDECIFGLVHSNGNKFCQLMLVQDGIETILCMLMDDDDDYDDDEYCGDIECKVELNAEPYDCISYDEFRISYA